MTFVGQLQLVLQVVEAVIDRSGREHQHLGLDTSTNHPLHQLLVTVGFAFLARLNHFHIVIQFLIIDVSTIAEIMALVNDYQVVVAPVDAFEVDTCRHSTLAAEVAMEKNVITQAVCHQRIVFVVGLEGVPVVIELLWTKHKHGFVAVLVILDDRKSGEGFAETNGVGKDAAIILFEFVDDGKSSISLEVI